MYAFTQTGNRCFNAMVFSMVDVIGNEALDNRENDMTVWLREPHMIVPGGPTCFEDRLGFAAVMASRIGSGAWIVWNMWIESEFHVIPAGAPGTMSLLPPAQASMSSAGSGGPCGGGGSGGRIVVVVDRWRR